MPQFEQRRRRPRIGEIDFPPAQPDDEDGRDWPEAERDVPNDPDAVDPAAGFGQQYDEPIGATVDAAAADAQASLDSAEARAEHRKLLAWFYRERDIQAVNRLEMAIDADFYDGHQWDEDDAQLVRSRGQMPLVHNEVAVMADWIIGTERRTRVDWRVLPRTEDDVELADVKTKVLKYVADVNRAAFVRSRAFTDAVKAGVGWVDDGVIDDPTRDPVYSKYEDWRNVLWDSASYELDLSDARYLFRWRWVDEDVAVTWFPERAAQIKRAAEEDTRMTGDRWDESERRTGGADGDGVWRRGGTASVAESSQQDQTRRRVRLIECQYRQPAKVLMVEDGPLAGAIATPREANGTQHLSGAALVERTMMRVHVAVFTESDLISMGPSIFRHNRFSLTPIWFYRDGRQRLPYGAIRRARDVQQDLNKRASKALFIASSNQLFMEEGATDDIESVREEARRPDGVMVGKKGYRLERSRDESQLEAQLKFMQLGANTIQRTVGVADENLGRQTNAVSGEAIKARQLQGSVVTTEPFDNLRLATQEQGEKRLSLVEQFYSAPKVARLTGARGAIEWVKVNQPEVQPDGSVRFLNDITASLADFVVAEADYAGTMRNVLFEQMAAMAAKMPPDVALRLMTVAMEFSDLPNKDQIAAEFRAITGAPDPSKEPTPEEQQKQAEAQKQQAEALEIQRQSALAALAEQQAKARELNARAAVAEAQARGAGAGAEVQQANDAAVAEVRRQADAEIERLSGELLRLRSGNDAAIEGARIDAAAKERVAEIQADSNGRMAALQQRVADLEASVTGVAQSATARPTTQPQGASA
jgi:hypothetical protein